tara:strand:+ start:7329 stop:8774 length:1446 start_codon:yes stop_codon:yes gene_type:complete
MCSFIFHLSTQPIEDKSLLAANQLLKSRGPDKTNIKRFKSKNLYVSTVHNLLDISGMTIEQPLVNEDEQLMLFNGEIYKPSDRKTPDTKVLFDQFEKGLLRSFLQNANGEYAIISIDLRHKRIEIYTDLIGTKPISFAFENGCIGIASYKTALSAMGFKNVEEVSPNSIVKISFDNLENKVIDREKLHTLNLQQDQNNLEHWNKLFLESVKDRAGHFSSKVFVPLSSGYDSGAICCALNKLNIPYITVTIGDTENQDILKKRLEINREFSCIGNYSLPPISWDEFKDLSSWLKNKIGIIYYSHLDSNDKEARPKAIHEDSGSIGLLAICKKMKSEGYNSMLSGTGADEIISDYGHGGKKYYQHSEFGGLFPDQLEGFFPWRKFYGDSQRSYLAKDEIVAGLFGIEGRYPFLEKELIQSFLRLTPQLKNIRYKNCIASFLENNNYPYEPDVKLGFVPQKTKFTIMQRIEYKVRRFLNLNQRF